MMVATYPTKKALKESIGKPLRFQETSMHGLEYKSTGHFVMIGPGAYNRKWVAQVDVVDDIITKVK